MDPYPDAGSEEHQGPHQFIFPSLFPTTMLIGWGLHKPCRPSGCHRITESDNHRMVGVGRDLWGSPSPTPCPSRVTQSRLHRTLSRRVLNISREGDSTDSLGSLGQGSVTLRGKKFFLGCSWSFLCSSLCPLPLVPKATWVNPHHPITHRHPNQSNFCKIHCLVLDLKGISRPMREPGASRNLSIRCEFYPRPSPRLKVVWDKDLF